MQGGRRPARLQKPDRPADISRSDPTRPDCHAEPTFHPLPTQRRPCAAWRTARHHRHHRRDRHARLRREHPRDLQQSARLDLAGLQGPAERRRDPDHAGPRGVSYRCRRCAGRHRQGRRVPRQVRGRLETVQGPADERRRGPPGRRRRRQAHHPVPRRHRAAGRRAACSRCRRRRQGGDDRDSADVRRAVGRRGCAGPQPGRTGQGCLRGGCDAFAELPVADHRCHRGGDSLGGGLCVRPGPGDLGAAEPHARQFR
ncbi:hypothetical protein GO279_04446 [Ralstonia solanacearum]|nr:hypothetical protein [Ralstonia solanacearum]NKA53748.1 hypothetical protein [Ralstonia solanacearum]NKA85923.1 hypothetical protein [Ralstonia solanacearum]NKF55587.1 hypothetical protein [Ralstonia solanacearum]NKF60637.1 hypothetical protein [Ralstonia solanacearum]